MCVAQGVDHALSYSLFLSEHIRDSLILARVPAFNSRFPYSIQHASLFNSTHAQIPYLIQYKCEEKATPNAQHLGH